MAALLRGRKAVLVSGAVVLAVASPLAFVLGSADVGDAVSASVVAATAVAALAVPLWPGSSDHPDAAVTAKDTGPAEARDGGAANSGVRGRKSGGSAHAEHTGSAVSHGQGSRTNTGIEDVS